MTTNIQYLTLEQILLIHEDQINYHGGSQGVRDLALLESAVFRPQTTFNGKDLYSTLFLKTAALMHSILLNHPFVDGNKRTGMVSGIVFLEFNGYSLIVDQKEFINTALKLESKQLDFEALASWLENNSKKN